MGQHARAVDPGDRRATSITFTDAGWQFLRDAYYVKREIEAEYSAMLGEEEILSLRSLLTALLDRDEQMSHDQSVAETA